jgi:hypothetical protein
MQLELGGKFKIEIRFLGRVGLCFWALRAQNDLSQPRLKWSVFLRQMAFDGWRLLRNQFINSLKLAAAQNQTHTRDLVASLPTSNFALPLPPTPPSPFTRHKSFSLTSCLE